MKKSILAAVAVVLMALCFAAPAQAQLRFGVKVGLDVNKLHFNDKLFDSDNRAGFTGGVMAEFTAPVIGLGFDISAMYVRRDLKSVYQEPGAEQVTVTSHRDYIEIPLNLKYKISIPAIGKVFSPFITTGPAVAFLTSRTSINEALQNKTVDCTWNFGLGAEILSRVQLHASYGIGLSNSVTDKLGINNIDIDGKTRCWTVTAAYLF